MADVASRPEVGSSRKMTLGSFRSCRATISLRFCPPLSPGPVAPPTIVSARSIKPVCQEREREREQLNRSSYQWTSERSHHFHDLLHSLELLSAADVELDPCC